MVYTQEQMIDKITEQKYQDTVKSLSKKIAPTAAQEIKNGVMLGVTS